MYAAIIIFTEMNFHKLFLKSKLVFIFGKLLRLICSYIEILLQLKPVQNKYTFLLFISLLLICSK